MRPWIERLGMALAEDDNARWFWLKASFCKAVLDSGVELQAATNQFGAITIASYKRPCNLKGSALPADPRLSL